MIINPYNVQSDTHQVVKKEDKISIDSIYEMVALESKDIKLSNKENVRNRIKEIIEKNRLDIPCSTEGAVLQIMDRIYGYGIIEKYIVDKYVTDIRITKYDQIYIKKIGVWQKVEEKFSDEKEFEDYVRFCALKNNCVINYETPIVVFTDKEKCLRIEAGIPPANVSGPSLVLRIHNKNSNISLESLFKTQHMLSQEEYQVLKNAVNSRSNIILCGKGGSGKTTLLKALIEQMPTNLAITTNEETAEMYLSNRNVIQRETILNRKDSRNVDLEKLMRHSLVMSNDAIIIGELKGAEASAFFDAISTGHIGLATVHADCTRNTIDRLVTLIKKDPKAQYYSEKFLREFLAKSIDYIVYLSEFKVVELVKIKILNNGEISFIKAVKEN